MGKSPRTTALVLIDLQNVIVEGEDPIFRMDETLANAASLLERARAADAPVIHVQHVAANWEPLQPGSPGFEIHPAVAPREGERIIQKRAADAFHGTALRSELDQLGVDRLVVAGCETEVCIDTTARRALSLDFNVIVAADAHSTHQNGALTAEQVIAHHNTALTLLPHPSREIRVLPSAEIDFT